MHQTSLHVYKDSAKAERNQANMEIRIDEKVTNADDVRSLGIKVGDFISFEPRMELTPSGFIKSRHLDDKVCVVIMLQLLKKLHKEEISLPYTTHFLFLIVKKLDMEEMQASHQKQWNILRLILVL